MVEGVAGENEEIKFTRADAESIAIIKTEVLNINKKLDENLSVKDKVNSHSVWIKVLVWTVSALVTAMVGAAAMKVW